MAQAATARPARSGPTMLADIVNIASPSTAPHTIRFSAALTATFSAQYRASFPGGKAKEQGGTIVADQAGNLSIQRLGGLRSTNQDIDFDMRPTDPARFQAIGMFHTHAYDASDGSEVGIPFSGGDFGTVINDKYFISIVQSGTYLFVCLKTAATPKAVNMMALHAAVNAHVAKSQANGMSFGDASRSVVLKVARMLNFAYYIGANGMATQV